MGADRSRWLGWVRRRSELGWFVRENALVLGLDVSMLVIWILVASEAFIRLSWPRWTYYALLFCGLIVYVQLSPGWDFPEEST